MVPFNARVSDLKPSEVELGSGTVVSDTGLVEFERYCHVYRKGELEELVEKARSGDKRWRTVKGGWEEGNWWVELEVVGRKR